MTAVITGDIINSKKGSINDWMPFLKKALNQYGEEPLNWEIFRGDSFQLVLPSNKAIIASLHIKSTIKQSKLHDVRMAIGIGEVAHQTNKITETNGSAYVRSGECFESLKKRTLAIKSPNEQLDLYLNLYLKLAALTIDLWSSTVASVITKTIEHPEKNQQDLALLLNKSQSNISEALKRGGFDELMEFNDFFKNTISTL